MLAGVLDRNLSFASPAQDTARTARIGTLLCPVTAPGEDRSVEHWIATRGWRDLPLSRLDAEAAALELAAGDLHVIVDRRPHDHLELLLAQIRTSPTHSGVVEVSGALVTGCHHGLPAGLLAATRQVDAHGHTVRVRLG